MISLDGFYILTIVVIAVIYYWLGYYCGKWDNEKKWNKDVMIINERLNQMLKKYEKPYKHNPNPEDFKESI